MQSGNDSVSLQDLERNLRQARAAAAHHAYADGFAELVMGAMCLAMAALFALEARGADGGRFAGTSGVGLPLVVFGGLLAARALVPRWRERVTYRRAGLAEPRQPYGRRGRVLLAVLSGAIGAGVGLAVATTRARHGETLSWLPGLPELAWLPTLQGLALGALLGLIGLRSAVPRFLLLAALAVALGLVVAASGLPESAGQAWFYGLLGAAALASGVAGARWFARGAASEASQG